MPYRFQAGESLPENLRRIVGEEVEYAVHQLSGKSRNRRDTRIHEARKCLKKLRGLLKLLRPQLGKIYQEENRELRDLGRDLSELRDAAAIIETFDHLLAKYGHELRHDGLRTIRQSLVKIKRDKEKALDVEGVMAQTAIAVSQFGGRATQWLPNTNGFKTLAAGLENTYRDGRKAMRKAAKHGRSDEFHAWRKRVKDHWYHIRLMGNLWPEPLESRENSLHDLESWLGDDHNLAVLSELLTQNAEQFAPPEPVQLFLAMAKQEREALREKALLLGDHLYLPRPTKLVEEVFHLWNAWQSQSPSARQTAA